MSWEPQFLLTSLTICKIGLSMRNSFNAKSAGVLICASMLISASMWSHTQAAERLGTPVWDVGQIPTTIIQSNHAYAAVYGDILVRSHGIVIMKDKTYPGKFIRVDIRQLGPLESQRLRRLCNLKACSEIMSGFIAHGRLQAIISVPFVSSNRPAVSPGLNLPTKSEL